MIALTANAFAGNVDVCLEAGMDAFVAKPVMLQPLAAALGCWLRRRGHAQAAAAARSRWTRRAWPSWWSRWITLLALDDFDVFVRFRELQARSPARCGRRVRRGRTA